ncbi:MAG: dephospho-CoA kinase [Ruminococcaceae bacterium]|nr:dephospho-CoA kinase [Oscillospiraceae bacterium]
MIELTQHKIIGLTGMSGAGKSTVCKAFADNGFHIIDCDIVSREVVKAGMPALKELAAELSPKLISDDGTLNRRLTGEMIFNDSEKRAVFNRIIYPYITYNVVHKIKAANRDILLDAPTLFDARLDGICTEIISVCANTDICVERIMQRDGITEEHARARLGSQRDVGWFQKHSTHCIINNGEKDSLFAQAQTVIKTLKGK